MESGYVLDKDNRGKFISRFIISSFKMYETSRKQFFK